MDFLFGDIQNNLSRIDRTLKSCAAISWKPFPSRFFHFFSGPPRRGFVGCPVFLRCDSIIRISFRFWMRNSRSRPMSSGIIERTAPISADSQYRSTSFVQLTACTFPTTCCGIIRYSIKETKPPLAALIKRKNLTEAEHCFFLPAREVLLRAVEHDDVRISTVNNVGGLCSCDDPHSCIQQEGVPVLSL